MDTISLNEAIIANLIDADGVDGTNIISVFRTAQQTVCDYIANSGFLVPDFEVQLSADYCDSVLIAVTQNGKRTLWS